MLGPDPAVRLRAGGGGFGAEAVLARVAGSRLDEPPDAQVRAGLGLGPPAEEDRRHEGFTR
jgi:hypothetical protein